MKRKKSISPVIYKKRKITQSRSRSSQTPRTPGRSRSRSPRTPRTPGRSRSRSPRTPRTPGRSRSRSSRTPRTPGRSPRTPRTPRTPKKSRSRTTRSDSSKVSSLSKSSSISSLSSRYFSPLPIKSKIIYLISRFIGNPKKNINPSKTALLKEILDFRYENILQEVRSTITRDIALPPKNIPKKYNQPIKLGIQGYFLDQGAQGIVYALDENKVLKVIPFKSEKSYQNEITTITNAVRLGISPKLYKHEYLKNFNTAVLESERLIVDLEDYLSDSILSFFEELKKGEFTVFKEFLSDCSYIIPRFYYIDSLSEKLDFGDTNVLKNFMFGRNGVLYYIDYSLPFISEEPIEVDIKEVILSRIEQYLEESGEISAKDSERILTTLMSQL